MKKISCLSSILVGVFCFGSMLLHAQQTNPPAPAPSPASKPSSTVLNLVNTPIAIEKDQEADKYFQLALAKFKEKNYLAAALQIRNGAQELLKEAPKDESNPRRKLVEQRIGELYGLSLRVEAGQVHDQEVLEDQFADADESLAHLYYQSANTLIDGMPEYFADRLLGLSVHLRNSKEYHNPAEKAQIGSIATEAADLASSIRKMNENERVLTPSLKERLNKLMVKVKALKLDE